jgi:hypothetical protein
MSWKYLPAMKQRSFEQLAEFINRHGGTSKKTVEAMGSNVVTVLTGTTRLFEYKTDGSKVFCRRREQQERVKR